MIVTVRRGVAKQRLLLATTLAAAICLMSLGSAIGASAGNATSPSIVRAPLDGSVTTSGGTWVDLAMGDLGQLANTFWQLLVIPVGHAHWSLVTPPGVADNGGLVSVQAGSNLVTGFEASQLIHFSPIASSSDEGARWTPGIVSGSLASVPDALAGTTNRRVVAITRGPSSAILVEDGSLSSWHSIEAMSALANSSAGRTCGLTALTAVSYSPSGQLLVGASCSRPGKVGVFAQSSGGWRLTGPLLPASAAASATSVLRLRSWNGGVSALIARRAGASTELIGARLTNSAAWSAPVTLRVSPTDQLMASGVISNGGLVVLLAGGGHRTVALLTPGAHSWTALADPPASTATVAVEPDGAIDALAVNRSQLTVYRLDTARTNWQRIQVMQVPIIYGSSG